MDPSRTIRKPNPSVLATAAPKPTPMSNQINSIYNGPLSQIKYRAFNRDRANPPNNNKTSLRPSSSSTVPRPATTTSTTSLSSTSSNSLLRPLTALPLPRQTILSTTTTTTSNASRLPTSGLIKPTPVSRIISTVGAVSSTNSSSQRSTQLASTSRTSNSSNRTLVNSGSIQKATNPSRLQLVVGTPRNSTALNNNTVISKTRAQSISDRDNVTSSTSPKQPTSSSEVDLLNLLVGHVAGIRGDLEQLAQLFQNPDTNYHESIEEENKRLRRENAELRAIINQSKNYSIISSREFVSTCPRPTNSDSFYSPMP